jgi:hypothetical protein
VATLGFDINGQRNVVVNTGARVGDIRFGVVDPRVPPGTRVPATIPSQPIRGRVVAHEDFLVAEPQANISARITRGIGVSCGVGYRETLGADVLGDRVNGLPRTWPFNSAGNLRRADPQGRPLRPNHVV